MNKEDYVINKISSTYIGDDSAISFYLKTIKNRQLLSYIGAIIAPC